VATGPAIAARDRVSARLPEGFRYVDDLIDEEQERTLLEFVSVVPLSAVVMRGYVARRRTAHFGVVYGFDSRRGVPGPPIPPPLLWLRDIACTSSGEDPRAFSEALLTEYAPGAVIGWHRDAPMFGPTVLGVSLGTRCRMRFRRVGGDGTAIERFSQVLEPRSLYVIAGPARSEWQHSIPAVDALRYSVTYRSVRPGRDR
jgi:alkylated DNA repair protein (DNA oxidative demethylase)